MNTIDELSSNETIAFKNIIEVMFHTRKDEGRLFLCALNNMIDYALNTNDSEHINYQIIHVPACPNWARELLLRFLIHKVALCKNETTLNDLSKHVCRNICISDSLSAIKAKNYVREIKEYRMYVHKLEKLFRPIETANNNRALIIAKAGDLTSMKANKNPYLDHLYATDLEDNTKNIILSSELTAQDLEDELMENISNSIDTIYIFHSPNKSRITNSYSINALSLIENRIKNCIVFSFTENPLRLYQTLDNVKKQLIRSLLQIDVKKYDDFPNFITLTQKESDYIFHRRKNYQVSFIDCVDGDFVSDDIDQILDTVPGNLRLRNLLSIAFTDELQSECKKQLAKEFYDFNEDIFANYFSLIKELWYSSVKNKIKKFIDRARNIDFVIPSWITPKLRKLFKSEFYVYGYNKVYFHSLDEYKKGKCNSDVIIVFQYRSPNGFYKFYPNSFDSLPLKEGQQALIVINLLTTRDFFQWDHFWYRKKLNELLYSDFRKNVLGWKKIILKKPTCPNVKDLIAEDEANSFLYQAAKCTLVFTNCQTKECLASERALYKIDNGFYCIDQLKDIADYQNVALQLMSEIGEQVKELMSIKNADISSVEFAIRRNPKFGLSEKEINSTVELWKILLKKKIDDIGEAAAYESIFSTVPSNEKISLLTFKKWYDFNSSLILPRSHRDQRILLSFLGFDFGSVYHRYIITKKMSNINNSRNLNYQIQSLLSNVILNNIDEDSYKFVSEQYPDLLTSLCIMNNNDLMDFKELIISQITLSPIERIKL